MVNITIDFSGGAELLVDGKKRNQVNLPDGQIWTIKELLVWIKNNLVKTRPELFIQDDSVRPGILVLINDSDWDLMGNLTYEIQENDNITFISTLHGG